MGSTNKTCIIQTEVKEGNKRTNKKKIKTETLLGSQTEEFKSPSFTNKSRGGQWKTKLFRRGRDVQSLKLPP